MTIQETINAALAAWPAGEIGYRALAAGPIPSVGDMLPASHLWDDGDDTGETMRGTACFVGDHAESRARRYHANPAAVLVIQGEDAGCEGMPEPGARVLSNARVLAVIQ